MEDVNGKGLSLQKSDEGWKGFGIFDSVKMSAEF
jgi:hypothetical protein